MCKPWKNGKTCPTPHLLSAQWIYKEQQSRLCTWHMPMHVTNNVRATKPVSLYFVSTKAHEGSQEIREYFLCSVVFTEAFHLCFDRWHPLRHCQPPKTDCDPPRNSGGSQHSCEERLLPLLCPAQLQSMRPVWGILVSLPADPAQYISSFFPQTTKITATLSCLTSRDPCL